MNKNKIRFYIVVLSVLAAFCVVALAVPFVKNISYWVCFGFTVLSILVQLVAIPRAMDGDARSKFYGFPILRISFVYLAVQVVLSLVFMALATWMPVWIPAVIFIVLLCAALVGFITTETVREEIIRQEVHIKKQISVMRSLQSKVDTMAAQCDGEKAKTAVAALAEQLRYSDPVSNDAIYDADMELSACIDNLQQAIVDGNEEDIITMCRKSMEALAERNRLCKLNK